MVKPYHVVIIGGGFGGVYTYKYLCKNLSDDSDIKITVIDINNYFVFTPLLHEVASGNQSPHNIVEPLRGLLNNSRDSFVMDTVLDIIPEKKEIICEGGSNTYDVAVIATGSTTVTKNIPGSDQHAFTLKTIQDAITLKNHCITCLEKSTQMPEGDQKKALLSCVIIGGGPTGVELACELQEFICGTYGKMLNKDCSNLFKITLIQKNDQLVPGFPEYFRKKALELCLQKGIDVKLGTKTTEISDGAVHLDDGSNISTQTVILTGGVRPNNIGNLSIETNEFLQVKNQPDIFALGDVAQNEYPNTAQVATRQAEHVAKNIIRMYNKKSLKEFEYNHSGDLLSLGMFQALGKVGPIRLSGPFAWFMWRTVYFTKLLTWNKRVKVGVDWFINLFQKRDISKIL